MLIGVDGSRAFTTQNTGTENYSLNLIKALAEVDRENHYRVYLRETRDQRLETRKLAKQFPKNFEFRPIHPTRLWTQIGLALETWRAPVDLLFVPAHTLPVLRNYRVKTVVTIHDLGVEYLPGYHQFPQKYYLDLASKYAAYHADRLIAVSEATKRDLIERYGVKSPQIDVVYEGVDKEFFRPQTKAVVDKVKKKYKISGDYFLYVGTVQPRKNLMFLIDTFNTYVKSISVKSNKSKYNKSNQQISLIIAGKMGWDYAKIAQKAADNIKFLGYVDRAGLPALYSGARAAVFPSLFEGFGLPILEALSSGCPVIASNIPVHRELFHTIFGAKSPITRGYTHSFSTSQSIKRGLNGQKTTNREVREAMVLANLNDERQWLSLLHQYAIHVDESMTNHSTSLLPANLFDWRTVAKETLAVFNKHSFSLNRVTGPQKS